MSYTTTYTTDPLTGQMNKLRQSLGAFQIHRADPRAMRQIFNELSAMNDRDLTDIDVARDDIYQIASQAVATP